MEITQSSWKEYIKKLRRIDERAAAEMKSYVSAHGIEDSQALIRYAKAISDRYGNAASTLACQMYDSVALASGVSVAAAEPAELATYGEVAKAVNGTKQNEDLLSNAVSRLCKMAAADTILNNAERDKAQFAWVPSGDSCAFCFTLASRGWQYMSKNARKNGHAEHIHANCDCTYAIRFSSKDNVEGYDPDAMQEEYYAEGGINGLRRKFYAQNKDAINAQKRANYRLKTSSEAGITNKRIPKVAEYSIDADMINSNEYKRKFKGITGNTKVDESIYKYAKASLVHRDGTDREDIYILSATDGKVLAKNVKSTTSHMAEVNDDIINVVRNNPNNTIGIHNHATDTPPTGSDFSTAFVRKYKLGVVATSDGTVYIYAPGNEYVSAQFIDSTIEKYKLMLDGNGQKLYSNDVEAHLAALEQLKKDYGLKYERR